MTRQPMTRRTLLITGAAGYLGRKLVHRLCRKPDLHVVASDVRPDDEHGLPEGVTYRRLDIRDSEHVTDLVAREGVDTVVHLAAIVTPGKGSRRELEYAVDVGGTENVLAACLAHGVRRLIVSSSGAAYGYHADNPTWLTEDHPLRGNREFPYAWHKRLVEDRLAKARQEHPELQQIVLRLGTVLGAGVHNQISNLFEKRRLVGIRGGDSRFVFIWDEDVAACLEYALDAPTCGIFNVAGSGALTLRRLAQRMGKPYVEVPAGLVRLALAVGKPLGLTRYGPEQVRFLQYRPVLDNRRLITDFGFTPQKTSSQVFDAYLAGLAAAKARLQGTP